MEVVPVTVEDVGARDLSLCLRRVDEGLQLLPGDELGLLDFEWLPPLLILPLITRRPVFAMMYSSSSSQFKSGPVGLFYSINEMPSLIITIELLCFY